MTNDWIIVYSTNKDYQADIVKQMLLSEGVEAQIINKSDSSFSSLDGDYEIYVPQNDEEKAKRLINDFESE